MHNHTPNSSNPSSPNRKVSPAEIKNRRKKGLCFGCGIKWEKDHKCRRSQLYQMLLEDLFEESESDEFVDCVDSTEELPQLDGIEEQAELSIYAMKSTSGFQTMRIVGRIKNHKMVMLVDSGSTHNFINMGVAKALGLKGTQGYQMGVTVANGEKVITSGKCQQMLWSCGKFQFATDFMILPVKGYDVLLDVQWLSSLEPIL